MRLLYKNHKKKLFLCLLLVLLTSTALASTPDVKIISLDEVLEAKRGVFLFTELSGAKTNLEKTKVSLYPNLSGSARVSTQRDRGLQHSSNYSFSWNTPIGINMQLKFIPKPSSQENTLSFSASTQIVPLPIYSNGLINLNNAEKLVVRAEEAEVQKLFNEELATYQNYIKAQIQFEKLLLQKDDLDATLNEFESVKNDFALGTKSKRDIEDKEIQYRNSYYQYQSLKLSFERQWEELCESVDLDGNSVPERLPSNMPKYLDFVWDLENDIEVAIERSLDVAKARDALEEAKRNFDSSKFNYVESSLGFNYNVKELEKASAPNWSINLNMSFNTTDIFFDFSKEENAKRYSDAKKSYLDAIKKVEKDIIRMKEDWELNLYQVQTKETQYLKTMADLEVKRLQYEAGALKEADYQNAKKSVFESYLDFYDSVVNFQVATKKAMFAVGKTDRVVIFN